MDRELEKPMGRLSGATALKAAALAVCAFVLLRHAWISDDAFITLRTVRNLVEGEGLRWNLHERVQGFTHPLWMFLLAFAYSLTHEPMAAGLLLSLGLSLATLYLVAFRLRLPAPAALLAMAGLVSSKSFVDYSTSGLENPLTATASPMRSSRGCLRSTRRTGASAISGATFPPATAKASARNAT
jgi:arabinofuranosyltransferase